MKIADYLLTYDLLDRTVTAMTLKDGVISIQFDLFHCDDMNRDVEGMEYVMKASTNVEDVEFREKLITFIEGEALGTVLSVDDKRFAISIDYLTSDRNEFVYINYLNEGANIDVIEHRSKAYVQHRKHK